MVLPDYQYRPLENDHTVRVLELHPALSSEDPLRCDIYHIDRDNIGSKHEMYEAVSYAWEGQRPTCTLECHGTRILITSTVDSFLRHVRKGLKRRNLWIDAICLNQDDAKEKGRQVYAMGEIYRLARKCHIWLGEERENDSKLFALCENCSRRVDSSNRLDLSSYPDSLESMLYPLQRPWFQRRWILQEVALSKRKTIRCGHLTIQWGVFRDVAMLNALADFECSDPRDRVFALLGMAQDRHRFDLSDYYDKSKSAEDLFHAVAKQFIQKDPSAGNHANGGGILDTVLVGRLLEFSAGVQQNLGSWQLPFWVPNWHSPMEYHLPRTPSFGDATLFTLQDHGRYIQGHDAITKVGTLRWTSENFSVGASREVTSSTLLQRIKDAKIWLSNMGIRVPTGYISTGLAGMFYKYIGSVDGPMLFMEEDDDEMVVKRMMDIARYTASRGVNSSASTPRTMIGRRDIIEAIAGGRLCLVELDLEASVNFYQYPVLPLLGPPGALSGDELYDEWDNFQVFRPLESVKEGREEFPTFRFMGTCHTYGRNDMWSTLEAAEPHLLRT
ncbi:hypothetical protein NA57DRAFT_57925 [Rhizodiscina lignyota]|uniref:Heterokaryon incompatibility domain-containing protein n=1 Tax=Rhizodiscina lignyota TaxID=1504668 RepID=A0A9P4M4V5_9PEZI|nr:hypothetical protein NA57DRAFT_57925 [Rhizodiscina lignyota]